MTDTPARQPQQEYIITEEEVDILQRNLSIPTTRILDDIRSRPHTSPPAPAHQPGCYTTCPFDDLCANDVEKIQAIEAAAAKAEREKVLALEKAWRADPHPSRDILNSFREICEKCVKDVGYEQEGCDPSDCLAQAQAEESLRAQQEQP